MSSEIGKYFLFTLLGMFLMYVILKIMSSKAGSSDSTESFIALAKTGQALNLVRTNEFREVVKTPEFRNFVKTLAQEQAAALAGSMINRQV